MSSKVCIYSNGFNFSFDKGCTLGMICPLLLSGPSEYAKPGWTVFVLTLCINDADYATVRNALKEIHPEMLLFTRRLRQIEISTPAPSLSTAPAETRVYSVNVDVNDTFNEYTICSHSAEIKNLRYLREEWDIFDMPEHPKRQEIRESKIVLAFPFNDSGPVISEQQIFAFMPLYRTPLPVYCSCSYPLLFSFSFKEIFSHRRVERGFLNRILGTLNYAIQLRIASLRL